MSRRFALIFPVLLLAVAQFAPARGDSAPPAAPISDANSEQLIVLRNGEVLRGRVTQQGDHYQLLLSDGELRIRTADVELVCKNLDEAYQIRRARLVANRADDHLDLAEWCLRQGLPGDAARELSAALGLDARNPRIALIDRRLQQSLVPPPAALPKASGAVSRVSDEDLDRMVRSLPPSAVEAFTTVVQPLLISSCATSGCHGPGGKSSYTLARIPADRFANRRLTQRNLQNTLLWVDFPQPQQSRLLTATAQAHGTATTAIFDAQTSKYRQLVAWVGLVTQRPLEVPEPATQAATVHLPGMGAGSNAGALGQLAPIAAADRDTRPVHPAHHTRPPLVVTVHPDGSTSSLIEADTEGVVPKSGTPSPAGASFAENDPTGAEAFNRQFTLPKAGERPAKEKAAPIVKPPATGSLPLGDKPPAAKVPSSIPAPLADPLAH